MLQTANRAVPHLRLTLTLGKGSTFIQKGMGSDRSYRVHEFAGLAGVTVKALHHYDRLGLLTPRRTEAGYRVYTGCDLERLEQIVALKFLGLPLRQIKAVLERTALELPDTLRLQRTALEEKQALLTRTAAAWARLLEQRERALEDPERVSFRWQAKVDLFRDIEAALGEDPAGENAQVLARRWMAQWEDASSGDPEIKAGLMKSWADRRNWPATLRWQTEGIVMMTAERFDKAADFLDQALAACDAA